MVKVKLIKVARNRMEQKVYDDLLRKLTRTCELKIKVFVNILYLPGSLQSLTHSHTDQ